MNRDQHEYDKQVQARNKEIAYDKLQKKAARLAAQKRIIKVQGQVDKARNRRENTLFEYREKIADCDKEKQRADRKLKYLRKKLVPKSSDKTDSKK
jgi:hypothetical protein